MPVYAKKPETEYVPAPEGLHQAVCADVWEPWTEERKAEWGGGLVEKTRICWEIGEINPKNGKPFGIAQIYTLSLHEKATLRAQLEAWRGRKFTAEELAGFDLEKLIGVNCQLQIVHKIKDGLTYANIQAIVSAPKSAPKLVVSKDYKRKKDRDAEKKAETAATESHEDNDADDSDIPF